jgi:hypothetical protein
MSANERFQADVEQTKADFSQLKSDAERKVAEAKVKIEVAEAKAKIDRQIDTEAAKDEAVFRAVSADAKAGIEKGRADDEAVFRGVSADAKAGYEALQAQRAQIKSTIDTKSGEARVKMQADLDRLDSEIAASRAAMAEYFDKRDAGQAGLN